MSYKLLNEMFSFFLGKGKIKIPLWPVNIILGYIMYLISSTGYIGFIFLKQNCVLKAHMSYFAE